jgi:ABC-2 type transport system ATP-binding protein
MIMNTAVQINKLTKVYENPGAWRFRAKIEPLTAVENVTFSVNKGELFGLLGPNGAGKTTLVKMLCTLILPSSGSATVAGFDLANEQGIRAATGLVVSDERSFFWRLSVQRNLDFFAAMYGLHGQKSRERTHSVLQDVNLLDRADQKFSNLSSGMRHRLAIARALLHEPRILFLDEPTRSLDPIATQQMHALILRMMSRREMTVFLITHDLSEAEKMCCRIALMHQSKIRKIGKPEELRKHLKPKRDYVVICTLLEPSELKLLQDQIPTLTFDPAEKRESTAKLRFQALEDGSELTAVLAFLHRQNAQIHSIDGAPPKLEEVFAHYTAGTDEE